MAQTSLDTGRGTARRARFWDRWAERYSRQPVADEAAYQHKLEITRRYLRPDMEVVEFGCGTGSTALVHAPHVRRFLATDISGEMLRIAAIKAARAGVTNIDFRQCGIETFTAPEGSVDMVLALSLLHLLDDPRSAIAKVHRLLKPGGIFVTSTACLDDMARWLRPVAPLGHWIGLLPRLSFFSHAELTAMMTEAGFRIEHDWQPAAKKAVFVVAGKPA